MTCRRACRSALCLVLGVALASPALGSASAAGWAADSPALPVPATQDVDGDRRDDLLTYAQRPRDFPMMPQPPFPLNVVFGKRDGTFVNVLEPGGWGYVLEGPFGWSLSPAGDINGDRRADLLVSVTASGDAVVVFGQSTTGRVPVEEAANEFRIAGQGLIFGRNLFVSAIGDVNSDGFDDLGATYGTSDSGATRSPDDAAAWIVLGSPRPTVVDLDRLGHQGSAIRVPGPRRPSFERLLRISGVGDFDGDGVDDVAIGSWYRAGSCDTDACDGRVWIVYGRKDLPSEVEVGDLGRRGITVLAVSGRKAPRPPYSQLGSAMSAAGDLDGDGYDDVLVRVNQGRVRGFGAVVWGKPRSRRPHYVALTKRTSRVGSEHHPVGDFDGDGRADLLGLPDGGRDGTPSARAFVVRGRRWAGLRSMVPRRPADGHLLYREQLDRPWFAAGDVNGDGRADISTPPGLLGYGDADHGAVIFGSSSRRRVSVPHPGSRGFLYGVR